MYGTHDASYGEEIVEADGPLWEVEEYDALVDAELSGVAPSSAVFAIGFPSRSARKLKIRYGADDQRTDNAATRKVFRESCAMNTFPFLVGDGE